MSQFIVSARKYRPTSFDTVVGQEQVTRTLSNAIASEKIAQAYLFCGPRGVGKTTCARIFAKEINKSAMPADADFSFNIFELDAASNNTVDDMRTITDQVRIPPQVGKYKVYIIDEVHMLSQQAFNAFLKTLEEPPPYAIFILATTEKHRILPTILSRCQIYDFKRIEVRDIVGHLIDICEREAIHYEEEALPIIAQKADGALRDALSIFDRLVSYNSQLTYQNVLESLNILDYDYYFKITDALLQQDAAQLMVYFDEILRLGFEGDVFINGLNQHFRDLLMCQQPQTVTLLEVGEQLQKRYVAQADYTPVETLLNGLNLFNTCEVHYKAAKNKRLHVELTLLKVCFLPQAIAGSPLPGDIKKKPERHQPTNNPEKPAESLATTSSQTTAPTPIQKLTAPTTTTPESANPDSATSTADTASISETPYEEAPQHATATEAPPNNASQPSDESIPEPPAASDALPEAGLATFGKRRRKSRLFEDLKDAAAEVAAEDETPDEPPFTGERPALGEEHLTLINEALTTAFDATIDSTLRAILDDYPPQIDGYMVKWVVAHKVQWELLNQNRMRIAELLVNILPEGFELQVDYDKEQVASGAAEKPMTVKEKLQHAIDKNPSLRLMQERLDLDLEY